MDGGDRTTRRPPLDTWLRDLEVPDRAAFVSGESFTATVTAGAPAEGLQLQVTYETDDDHVRTASVGTIVQGTETYEATLDGADAILSITFLEVERPRPPTPSRSSCGTSPRATRSSWGPGRRCGGAGAMAR